MERHLGDGTRITRRNILKGAAAAFTLRTA